MPQPDISIVVATRNRADQLKAAVDSMFAQSCQDFELIIVNDASSDHTPEFLDHLAATDPRVRIVHLTENAGPGETRNAGIRRAAGRHVAIMDDDDVALPERLELQRAFLARHPAVGMVFSPVELADQQGRVYDTFPPPDVLNTFPADSRNIFRLLYLENNKIPNSTVMFRRELAGNFRYPAFTWIGEDWFLFLTLAAQGVGIAAIPRPLVKIMRHEGRSGMMEQEHKSESQRNVLHAIRQWLDKQNIHDFDDLHDTAMHNQLIREKTKGRRQS